MGLDVADRAQARATTDASSVRASGAFAGYRPDIQGLRAIAVALVVAYHLAPSLVPGGFVGVDVFFVISGFLITSHLWRGYQRSGRVDLVAFWGRRARRLLPAAVLVLVVTWLVARVALPTSRLVDTAGQIRASALYVQNWVLAHDSVQYLKSDDAASPVQHFWSLSVEEQFYLFWPLLFLAAAVLVRRRTSSVRRIAVLAAAGVVAAASLAYSVYFTASDPSAAYFVTTTRMWELAVGGVLALLPASAARWIGRFGPLGWVGLVMVLGSAMLLSGTTAFPGTAALIPVLGAALVIACGSAGARLGPAAVTSLPGMVFVGGISYSLYLWHWPAIVLWTSWSCHALTVTSGLTIAAGSVLLAWLTTRFVEAPVRTARLLSGRWRSLSVATAALVPAALVTVFLVSQPAPWDGRLGPDHPGAAALAGTAVASSGVSVLPPVASAAADIPEAEKQGCLAGQHDQDVTECTFGDTTNPTRTIALVGDSMAEQWFAPLEQLAEQNHWKLVTMLHATCAWTATTLVDETTGGDYQDCQRWGAAVLDRLVGPGRPDAVVTTARLARSAAHPDSDEQSTSDIAAGMTQYWARLADAGISIVPIRETPELDRNVPDCLSGRSEVTVCSRPVAEAISARTPITEASSASTGVRVVDMNSLICGTETCQPVVGNVVVYRDSHHLTNSYSRTLAPYLGQKLAAGVPALIST